MSIFSAPSTQGTVLSNWERLQLAQRQTRKERAEFPRRIPHVFADASQLPIRLLKGKRLTRLVQYTGLGAVMLAATILTGCSGQITEPTVEAAAIKPLHHNIPAMIAGQETGPMLWLCETQPRGYVQPGGQRTQERDHYLQYSPCPATPIN